MEIYFSLVTVGPGRGGSRCGKWVWSFLGNLLSYILEKQYSFVKNSIESGVKRSALQTLYKSRFSRKIEPIRYISVSLSLRDLFIMRNCPMGLQRLKSPKIDSQWRPWKESPYCSSSLIPKAWEPGQVMIYILVQGQRKTNVPAHQSGRQSSLGVFWFYSLGLAFSWLGETYIH